MYIYSTFEHGNEAILGSFAASAHNCLTPCSNTIIVMQVNKVNGEKGYDVR